MTAPVDLCNMALDQIGAAGQQISGISPPLPPSSLAAQVATRTYQTQISALFRSAHWNSARAQTKLTLLKAAWGTPENPAGTNPQPPTPFQYEYALPNDCLKVRFCFPNPLPQNAAAPIMTNTGVQAPPVINTAVPFVVASDFDTQGNRIRVILTNACQAQCVYTARIDNPDNWDSLLQNAAIATLAAWFVNPLLRNSELLKERVQIAVGLIEQARISDGDEGIMSVDHFPDWIQVRGIGGWAWGSRGLGESAGNYFAGWDAISMPNGLSY